MIKFISEAELDYKGTKHGMAIGTSKIENGSRFIIGGEGAQFLITLDQRFNWFQKLMWKLCFGVKVEDYSEE